MRRIAALLLVLLVSRCALAADEALRVRADISASSLNVAQRATLHVVCEIAQGWTLVAHPFDKLGVDDPLGPLLVASRPRATPARFESGWTTWEWTIELTPDLPESGQIPALRFKAELIEGDRFAIKRTEPIPVVIESLLEQAVSQWDPTTLRPALEPLPEPEESRTALVVSLGVVAIVGAGALALVFVGGRKRDPERERARLLESCRSQVMAIDADAPVAEVASVAHASVRTAMAEVAGPRALAATGESLGPLLRRDVGLSPVDAALVCDFFASVDLALYTDHGAGHDQSERLRGDALRVITSVGLAAASGVSR
jgi:hypothetical protein